MMSDNFSTFEKFSDPELAATIASQLQAQGIGVTLVNESPLFDPTFANNIFEPTIQLKVRSGDFKKARRLLERYYQGQLAGMDPDYYLFSFSDDELLDLVRSPDEWGPLDYVLAKQILAGHGKQVSPEQEDGFQAERIRTLALPEESKRRWVVAGYVAAVFCPLAGLILGYILTSSRKTLPDGSQVLIYSAGDQRQGKRISILATIVLALWFWQLTGARIFS
jgi:hypothetical protein